jgi:hypothetical protein
MNPTRQLCISALVLLYKSNIIITCYYASDFLVDEFLFYNVDNVHRFQCSFSVLTVEQTLKFLCSYSVLTVNNVSIVFKLIDCLFFSFEDEEYRSAFSWHSS